MEEGESKSGRPTKYREEYADQAFRLCLLGMTNEQLASYFEVAVSTVSLWISTYQAFSDAVKSGRDEADGKIAQSLYQRGLGYSHPDTDIRVIEGQIVKTEIVKHYPPDTAAAFIWLKNRQPATWRDKRETEVTGNVTIQATDIDEKL